MKSATSLRFTEKLSRIGLDASLIDSPLRDSRNGLQLGTIRQSCLQYGIDMAIDGDTVVLTAPRDRLQPMAERLHYCRMKFLIL